MSFINEREKEINCKIVYYGPPRCGKSTSLRHVCDQIKQKAQGDLISLTSENDKTLYFDFVPLTIGKVGDYTVRLHLYTVPGEMAYDANRKIISKGVDGFVFMADSQIEKVESNITSLAELKEILDHEGTSFGEIPHVICYNKRDLKNAAPVSELRGLLNKFAAADFETVAVKGEGVFDALKSISTKVLLDLKKAYKK